MQTKNPSSDRHFMSMSAPRLTVIVMAGWHQGHPAFPQSARLLYPEPVPLVPCRGRQAGVVVPI